LRTFWDVGGTKLYVAKFQSIFFKKWPSGVGELWRTLVVAVWQKLEQWKVNMIGHNKHSNVIWRSIDLVAACFIAANKDSTLSETARLNFWRIKVETAFASCIHIKYW
jgi:hypothetical protein